jgi:GR25 family glycosyltransferase involved in LPS biosynthesis
MDDIDFVCISLIKREDRREKVASTFDKLGITDKINWWLVDKHPTSGVNGCFESHYSVIVSDEFCKPYLCVFEDDILIDNDNIEKFYHMISNLPVIDDGTATIINMDPCFEMSYRNGPLPGFTYGYGFNCSAYIIPRTKIPLVSNYISSRFGMPIDIALFGLDMLLVFIFEQEKADSDINPRVDKMFSEKRYEMNRNIMKNKVIWFTMMNVIVDYNNRLVKKNRDPIIDRRQKPKIE